MTCLVCRRPLKPVEANFVSGDLRACDPCYTRLQERARVIRRPKPKRRLEQQIHINVQADDHTAAALQRGLEEGIAHELRRRRGY